MTNKEKIEIKGFLISKGFPESVVSMVMEVLKNESGTGKLRDSKEAKRARTLINFKPNPGSLNTGPDTTENIKEEYYWNDNYPGKGCNKNVIEHPDIFEEILEDMSETHRKKNHDYGDAAHLGYLEMGMPYYLGIIFNKYHRLKTLTLGKERRMVLDESVEDTLLDLANYAVLALESLKRDGQKQQGQVDD